MNINNFEKQISGVILERGSIYFKNGAILEIDKIDDNEWIAEVEGTTENYEVEVNLNKKLEITDYSCTCPYDGDVCKHVVAVLLSIKKEVENKNLKKNNKKDGKKREWEAIIQNAPEQQIRAFLLKYAQNDEVFRNELIISLGEVKNEISTQKYRKIIKQSFNSASRNSDFVDYSSQEAAIEMIQKLISQAETHIKNQKQYEAFSIFSAVAMESIDMMHYIDDSDGDLGDIINEAFSMIDKMMESNAENELNTIIFNWFLEQVKNKDYDDFGCADELEPIFFGRAQKPSNVKYAYQFIDEQLKALNKKDSFSKMYHSTKYLKFKIDLLKWEGKNDEAEEIINQNMNLFDFRQLKIDEAIENEDYPKAILLLNEGIILSQKERLSGVETRYRELLLHIYTKTKDLKNVKLVSKQLLDDHFSIENYRNYKKNCLPDEWQDECLKIIANLSKKNPSRLFDSVFNHNLASVYIEEKMFDKLLESLKLSNSLPIIDSYKKHLPENFSDDLIVLYKKGILKYAENAGRDIYSNIVGYLRNMATLKNGEAEAKRIRLELLEVYKNRKAMKEEFGKLKW